MGAADLASTRVAQRECAGDDDVAGLARLCKNDAVWVTTMSRADRRPASFCCPVKKSLSAVSVHYPRPLCAVIPCWLGDLSRPLSGIGDDHGHNE
jgi:hypothetical protein